MNPKLQQRTIRIANLIHPTALRETCLRPGATAAAGLHPPSANQRR